MLLKHLIENILRGISVNVAEFTSLSSENQVVLSTNFTQNYDRVLNESMKLHFILFYFLKINIYIYVSCIISSILNFNS